MQEAVIVDAVRTPTGKRNGKLKGFHPVSLGSLVLKELIQRSGIDGDVVEDVVFGCVNQVGEQGWNVGRNAWLAAGLPVGTPATTITRTCGSSQQAVHFAANLIQSEVCQVTIAGGVESMTRVPLGSSAAQGPGVPYPPELLEAYELVPQGIAAEMVARKYGISRRAMDEFSVRSHQLAAAATSMGRLRSQMMSVTLHTSEHPEEVMAADEGIRYDASYEAVARLKPAFHPDHSITAANSSQISDGAAAVLLMSQRKALDLGVPRRARVLAQSAVGTDPVLMAEGPIPATASVLKKAGLSLRDIDLFEVSEAFATVPLAWLQVTGADPAKLNVNGGAIAIGHPLGASGARLIMHLLYELERRDLRYGLATMCCGGGLGIATILDRQVD